MTPDDLSLQERFFPAMTCFGCGPSNPRGLRLRSFASATGTVAAFTPWPEHDNGLGFLNGGIICTLLDCHSATPMLIEAERLGLITEAVPLPYVTAGLDVRYLRPTPLAEVLQLTAEATAFDDDVATIAVEIQYDGKTRAAATAVWKRWRPR